MRFRRFLFALLVGVIVCVRSTRSDLITTYREFKVIQTPTSLSDHSFDGNRTSNNNNNDNQDVSFYVEADEHLEKLQSQAEELRDTYNELIKSAFGRELKRNRTVETAPEAAVATTGTSIEDSSEVVGGARKVSADWVRAAINPMLFKHLPSMDNNRNETFSAEKIKRNE